MRVLIFLSVLFCIVSIPARAQQEAKDTIMLADTLPLGLGQGLIGISPDQPLVEMTPEDQESQEENESVRVEIKRKKIWTNILLCAGTIVVGGALCLFDLGLGGELILGALIACPLSFIPSQQATVAVGVGVSPFPAMPMPTTARPIAPSVQAVPMTVPR